MKYIIRAYGIKEIFIPYYSCDCLWRAARKEACRVRFYHIDNNMTPICDFPKNAYILYINYFGLCGGKCIELAQKYPNLIVDNTQAFYSEPIGMSSFNSLRKFFKVQNGVYLWCDKFAAGDIKEDDLYLPPVYMNENFDLFVKNELVLNKETEIKKISPLAEKSLKNMNFAKDKIMRRDLYKNYEIVLGKYNLLHFVLDGDSVPYCYPFGTDNKDFLDKLSKGGFILLKLWDNKSINGTEVIAFPLYDEVYAKKILDYCAC